MNAILRNQQDALDILTRSISAIRHSVRRQIYLPRAIHAIHVVKTKTDETAQRTDLLERPYDRLNRLQNSITDIRTQIKRGKLPRLITRIKDSLTRDFETNSKARYQLLLRALKGEGIPLATLSVCGRGTREIRYTQLLRYFLDPQEPHGLNCKVVSQILSPTMRRVGFDARGVDWSEAQVEAEFWLGNLKVGSREIGCTADLLILVDDFVILIENKINSPEAGNVSSGETSQL